MAERRWPDAGRCSDSIDSLKSVRGFHWTSECRVKWLYVCVRGCMRACVRACVRAFVSLVAWTYVHTCVLASEQALIGGLYSDTLGVLVFAGSRRKTKLGWSTQVRASSLSSSSAPIYALPHFNQRSIEEAVAGRARFIELSSILRGRPLGVRSASVRSNEGSIIDERRQEIYSCLFAKSYFMKIWN